MIKGLITRKQWVESLDKIAYPVINGMASDNLKKVLPLCEPHEMRLVGADYLEAIGRTIAGIAPWIELSNDEILDENEKNLQNSYREMTRKAIDNATNPYSKDYCLWNISDDNLNPCQPVVDTAYFVSALLKAPNELFYKQEAYVQHNILNCVYKIRSARPMRSNWLMFSAMIEVFLYKFTGTCEPMKIEYALSKHMEWYVGDGFYKDGDSFMMDYYNSYVIQPMLEDVIHFMGDLLKTDKYAIHISQTIKRYCEILERSIAPDGTYPPLGRSIIYRMSAFYALSHCAYREILPKSLENSQVRCALDKVIKKTMSSSAMFDEFGFLTIGVMGKQENLANYYTNIGSLYICTNVFVPLGLSPSHAFWNSDDKKITWEKFWDGEDLPYDNCLHINNMRK